jgi:hypothetical protein
MSVPRVAQTWSTRWLRESEATDVSPRSSVKVTSSLIPVAAVAVLFVVLVAWLTRRRMMIVLSVYLLVLLIHEVIIRLLSNALQLDSTLVTAISLWKDLALVGLVIGAAYRVLRREKRLTWRLVDWLMGAFVVVGAFSAVLSPDRLAGIAAFRDYFEVVVIFYLARLVGPTELQLRSLLIAWAAVGALIAVLGIWQAVAWTAAEYKAYGFAESNLSQSGIPSGGARGLAGPRPPSTLTGPNEFGLHMALFVFMGVQVALVRSGWPGVGIGAATLIFFLGMALSGSRSDLAGALVGLCLIALHDFQFVKRLFRGRGRTIAISALAIALVLLALSLMASGMVPLILRTLGRLPNEYHVRDTLDAMAFIVAHPAGVGMGLVGPRQGFGFPSQAVFHVEGSLFQIAVEMGVWGLAAFLGVIGVALRDVWRSWAVVRARTLRVVCGTAVAGWVAALVAFLFLPLMQALPLMAWLWFLLGLGLKAGELQMQWSGGELPSDGGA